MTNAPRSKERGAGMSKRVRNKDKYDIPILDYTYMDICYDTTYFYNAMHLNALGADLFSEKLAHDLASQGFIPSRQ